MLLEQQQIVGVRSCYLIEIQELHARDRDDGLTVMEWHFLEQSIGSPHHLGGDQSDQEMPLGR